MENIKSTEVLSRASKKRLRQKNRKQEESAILIKEGMVDKPKINALEKKARRLERRSKKKFMEGVEVAREACIDRSEATREASRQLFKISNNLKENAGDLKLEAKNLYVPGQKIEFFQ